MTFIFWLSGHSELPGAPGGFPLADKLAHIALYLVLGALMYSAMRCSWARMPDRHVLIFALGAVVIYGISDEIHQGFVSMREPGILDLLADSISADLAKQLTNATLGQFTAADKQTFIKTLREKLLWGQDTRN